MCGRTKFSMVEFSNCVRLINPCSKQSGLTYELETNLAVRITHSTCLGSRCKWTEARHTVVLQKPVSAHHMVHLIVAAHTPHMSRLLAVCLNAADHSLSEHFPVHNPKFLSRARRSRDGLMESCPCRHHRGTPPLDPGPPTSRPHPHP